MISEGYKKLLSELHKKEPRWGASGRAFANSVVRLVKENRYTSVLDYGAGKGALLRRVRGVLKDSITLTNYDPAVEEWSAVPTSEFDLVVCTDVLEHVEYQHLSATLSEISFLTRHRAFLVIHTGPAETILPDGRNAHLIQRPPRWWRKTIVKHFFRIESAVFKAPKITIVARNS